MTSPDTFAKLQEELGVLIKPFGAERRYRCAWARTLIIDAEHAEFREAYDMLTEAAKIMAQQALSSYEPYRPSRSLTMMQREALKAMGIRMVALRSKLVTGQVP